LVLASGAAHAEECPARAPSVRVETAAPIVVRNDTLDMAELGRRQSAHTLVSAAERAVFGLTESTRDARLVVETAVEPRGQGAFCVRLDVVRVVVTPKIRVHLARETLRDACFSEHVLAHELRHVALETSAADADAVALAAALEALAATIPGRVLDAGGTQEPLLRELVAVLGGELRRLSVEQAAARQHRHKEEVDDPDSGSALTLCDGFGRRLVEGYRRQLAGTPAG
jgi:hypothetical protein